MHLLARSPVASSSIFELDDSLLTDLERKGLLSSDLMQDVIRARPFEELLQTGCRRLDLSRVLRGSAAYDIVEFFGGDGLWLRLAREAHGSVQVAMQGGHARRKM